jgi:hypothetical protein
MIALTRTDLIVVRNHLSVLKQSKVEHINIWPFCVEVGVKEFHYMVAGFVSTKFAGLTLSCSTPVLDIDKEIKLVWDRGGGSLLYTRAHDNNLHWFNLQSLKLGMWVDSLQTVKDHLYFAGQFESYFEKVFPNPKVLFDRNTRAFRKERVAKEKLSEIEFEIEQGDLE